MLAKSWIPTLVGNSKCMKPRCQVCDMLETRKKIQITGTSSTIQPENSNCDSWNIVYLLMCDKCDSGNYIGETSNRLRSRLNNHKKHQSTAGVSGGCSFRPTRPFLTKFEMFYSERQTDSLVNKRSYINSRHIQKLLINIYHFYRRIATFTSVVDL